jgi:hypothetical protein
MRVVWLYAGDHWFLLPQDHSFLVALRDVKSPDMDFFFQNKAARDDYGLLHDREYCRIAFLPNGRDDFDFTANRYSFDLQPFVVQHFIDESLVLARNGADLHHIARGLALRYGEIFCVERDMWFPCWR